jgi:hypothetical protein
MSYNYSYKNDKFWFDLRKGTINENTGDLNSNKIISYISDTGQFISNCYLFIYGIEAEEVTSMIDNILSTVENKETLLSIDHLKNEDFIASYLFKYIIQNNTCDYNLIIRCLEYLFDISKYLAEKLKLKIDLTNIKKNKLDDNYITRCSYKFCNYTYFCQFNYPEKNNNSDKGCYSDHYVHNKVAQDIYFLIEYIKKHYNAENCTTIRNNQEIIKCINTATFVIKHMYDELHSIYISCNKKPCYEELHNNIYKIRTEKKSH